MNTTDDMQNEMDFNDHYNVFEYNHDYEKYIYSSSSLLSLL